MSALDELKTLHPFIGGVSILRYTPMIHIQNNRGNSRCHGVQDGLYPPAKASRQRSEGYFIVR